MAIISSSSEFTRGGGVTWDDGLVWKVSDGLVGGLGMRMEHWAGTAAARTGTSSTNKNKKNRRQLRSTVNISNPLSSSSTTDHTATAIITVPVSGVSSAGVGAGVEADVYVSCFKSSSARFFETVRNCGLLVVGYFLWVVLSSVGKGKMARFKKGHGGEMVRTKKKARVLGKKFRAVRWKLWMWARLIVLTPWVFFTELWVSYYLATHYSEEHFEGIYSRGVGGITLVPVDAMMGDGGRVVERGRGRGSGGGKKASKPSFFDRAYKVFQNKIGDLKLTLKAIIALVWCLICRFFSGILSGLAYVFLLPDDEAGGASCANTVSGAAVLTLSEEDNDSNQQESDTESSGKNGKDKKPAAKKADNAGGQRRKGKKKGKKR